MTTLEIGKPLRVAFGEAIAELGEQNNKIIVLDGDTGSSTRTDIFEAQHPDRFFQMGITEQNMVGMAAGMATLGLIPIVSTFSCFIVSRAHDSIRVLIAQPNANVKLMGGYSGLFAGMTGKTHLIFDDISIMRSMPNMTIVAPVDEAETRSAMRAVVEYDGPVFVRLTRPNVPKVFADGHKFTLGKTELLNKGEDVTIFSTGTQTARAVEATRILAREGIQVQLVHVPTVKPLDVPSILANAQQTGLVVTTEEHSVIGGLGSAVADALAQNEPLPIKFHGLADTFGESGPDSDLLEKYGLSSENLAGTVREFVRKHTG